MLDDEAQRDIYSGPNSQIKAPILLVFPNPAEKYFTIEYAAGEHEYKNCLIQIIDLRGKVLNTFIHEMAEGSISIDASEMKAGTYQVVYYLKGNALLQRKLMLR